MARGTGRAWTPPEPGADGAAAAYEPEWEEQPEQSPDHGEAAFEPEWSLEAMTVGGLDTEGWSNDLVSPFATDHGQQPRPAEAGGGRAARPDATAFHMAGAEQPELAVPIADPELHPRGFLPSDALPAYSPEAGTAYAGAVPTRSRYHIPEGDEHAASTGTDGPALEEEGEWKGPEIEAEPSRSPALADAVGKRDWGTALKQAIDDGWRSENDLTNLIFFGKHKELGGRKLDPKNNKADAKLAVEWTQLRDKDVREAIERAAGNPVMGVSGDIVAEFHREFRGNWGLEFRARVEWAAKEVNINPGLLATCLIAETGSKWIYLSPGLVSSYHIGTDDFYEARFALRSKVSAYQKIGWDTTQTPVVHLNDAKRPRNVSSINFNSGKDALLATAVYLKYGEVYLHEQAVRLNGDFDSLPAEIRFALTRMTMAAGRAGATPYLASALKGQDILDRANTPAVIYQTARNATIRSAQALFLSEWVFGITLPPPVAPATTPRHEHEAPAAFAPDGAVSVEPFPATARALWLVDNGVLPGLARNDKLFSAMQALKADPDTKDICVAVVDLRPGPIGPLKLYQGYNDHDMLYVGSLQKISPMYAAFELRARVRKHVKAAVAAGLTVNAANWKKMQADIKAAWQPKLDAAFSAPRGPGFPDLASIFTLTPPDKVKFTPSFRDSLTQMVKCSDNQEASKCILALSYPYINGVLRGAGFFEPDVSGDAGEGLWISGNYHDGSKDWIPDPTVNDANAGQIKTLRWQTTTTPPRIKTNFAATAQQVARMYALLAQDRLVNNADPDADVADPDTSKEIRALLALAERCASSFIGRILRAAHHPLDAIFSKIGIDAGDEFVHDGGIVQHTLGGVSSRYVVAALGMNNDRHLLEKVFLTIDTALS